MLPHKIYTHAQFTSRTHRRQAIDFCRSTKGSSTSCKSLPPYFLPILTLKKSSVLPIKYPTSFFLQLLLLPTHACLVACHPANPNDPVAFISASLQAPRPTHDHLRISSPSDEYQPLLNNNVYKERPHIEILTLGVLPAYQQRGVARLLVRRLYDHFRQSSNHLHDGTLVHANVATSNSPALSFYERMGMRITSDVIRNLYRTCAYGSRDAYLVVGLIYF